MFKLNVKEAVGDKSLKYVASTYDPYDQVLNSGVYPNGRKVVTFSGILENDSFPLADALTQILNVGQKEMGRPIEIEFALNIEDNERCSFYLLQIRPIVDAKDDMNEDLTCIKREDTIIECSSVLGQGIINDVYDVVYVKSRNFDAQNNGLVAREIEKLNREYIEKGNGYVLVGPGRWGSSDPWLGIPVKWPHISGARAIVECSLEQYRVDPSQGTHFFQNLTSFGVGYFTIAPFNGEGFFDEEYLNSLPALHETEYIRSVKFNTPILIKMDGRHGRGVVMKPQ